MNVAGMAAAIEGQLTVPITNPAQFALAMATAIVQYIQANALVPGTGLVAPAGGGPVTGAAVVT